MDISEKKEPNVYFRVEEGKKGEGKQEGRVEMEQIKENVKLIYMNKKMGMKLVKI